MLLKPLTDALTLVSDRIKNFEREFTNNETQTRLSLVDPVLTALGWNPQDPSTVRVEFSVRQRNRSAKVDYALLEPNQTPIALVEAKKLGTDLGDAHLQLFEYAVGKAVPYLIATNGADWAVYKWEQHSAGMGFSKLLAVSITDQPSILVAIKLLSMWRELLTSQSSIDQIAPALSTLKAHHPKPATAITQNTGYPEGNAREELAPSLDGQLTFTLSNPPATITGRKPALLSLPGEVAIQIKNWSSLLIEATWWLLKSDRLNIQIPWKENPTSKRYVLQSTPVYSSRGMRIKQQKEIKSDLYLLYNFDATGICKIAAKLLDECGIHSSEVKVTLAQQDR